MKVSFVLPSKGRPELFEKCVHRIIETTKPFPIEIITIAEDADTYGISLKLARQYNEEETIIKSKVHITPKGAIFSWNQGLKQTVGDFIVPMHDDGWCGENWLQLALDAHSRELKGFGMIGLNDSWIDGNTLATQVIYDRDFCIRALNGSIACPHYQHLFIDNEFNARAKRNGAFYWCKESYMYHKHSAHNQRPPDQNDSEHSKAWDHDQQIFLTREKKGFPNDWEPFITE